jgi:hypothetical protein
MRTYRGRVVETILEPGGETAVKIACPAGAVPAPGQFVMAYNRADPQAPIAEALFSAGEWENGFIAASPTPYGWGLGTILEIRGPLGHGFHLPTSVRKLAVAALEGNARVAPLILQAHERHVEAALLTDSPLPSLPVAVEAYPLAALPDVLHWADLLVLDLPLSRLKELRGLLSLGQHEPLPCPAYALLVTPMPCYGTAECGACAVPSRNGQMLACLDGPVFDLNLLEW